MKPTPEFERKMRLRSDQLRRSDETEWSIVCSCLRESAPKRVVGLAFDDRAWDLWFRFRGQLPHGWHSEWLPVCIRHGQLFSSSSWALNERAVALGRLSLADRWGHGKTDDKDLALLRSELYVIAELAFDIQEVEL